MYNTTIKFIKDNFQDMKNDFNNSLEIYEFIEINNKKYKLNLLFIFIIFLFIGVKGVKGVN